MKNIKISEKHHNMLKIYCDSHGLKIYKVLQKWIDEKCKTVNNKKTDLYDE